MRVYILIIFIIVLVSCSSRNHFDGFEKMAGNWLTQADSNGFFNEKWIIEGDVMHGQGYYIRGEDTLFNEKLKVRILKDTLTYTAIMPNGDETDFKLKTCSANNFYFENQNHDYPRTIEYYLQDSTCKIYLNGIEDNVPKRDSIILMKQK